MGLETIAAQIIIVGAFLYMAVAMVSSLNDNTFEINKALISYHESEIEKSYESFMIDRVSYTKENITTSIVINNTGNIIINLDYLDFYIDGVWIPRNNTNRTIIVNSSHEFINPRLWDPYEVINVNISHNISSGNHYVEIFSKKGRKDIMVFNVV